MNDNTLALLGGKPVLSEPYPLYNPLGEEEKQAALEVMEKRIISDFVGRAGDKFLGGEYVKKLEREMCEFFKVKYAVSFNSATTALQGAVSALGIGPGDEVITSPFTMSATASAILYSNAIPVFADINEDTYCLDPESVEKNITEKTKAILTVNIFGGSSDFAALLEIARKYGLKLIEDNAQSIGAKYKEKYLGTIGDIGVFSFNVHKHIQCGEGGVLVTDNEDLAFRAQLARNHGEVVIDDLCDKKEPFEPILGSNYRLSELHAAIAVEQLKKVSKLNEPRVELADYLSARLEKIAWLKPAEVLKNSTHVYYVYPFKFSAEIAGISRKTFAEAMAAEGFPLNQGYTKPLYLMQMYQEKKIYPNSRFPFVSEEFKANADYSKGICSVAERLYEKELLLTTICHPPRTKKDIDDFIEAVEKIDKHITSLRDYEQKA